HDFGELHVGATLMGGQLNPLRIDETTGRRLNGQGSPLFFGFPTAFDLGTTGVNAKGQTFNQTTPAQPSYLEDTVVGGRAEAGTKDLLFAGNAAYLLRRAHSQNFDDCIASGRTDCDSLDIGRTGTSQAHNKILNFSGSVSL